MIAAAAAALAMGSCTGTKTAPPAQTSPSTARPSLTFDEAAGRVPINGTERLPITWDSSEVPDTDVVLAARRSLAYHYWMSTSADWTPLVPVGRALYTEKMYSETLASFAGSTDSGADSSGVLWIKTMGVEETRPNQVRVNFCTDTGYLRYDADSPAFREDRAYLQSQDMQYVKTADGTHRWLLRGHIDNAVDRTTTYGAQCAKWAIHQP